MKPMHAAASHRGQRCSWLARGSRSTAAAAPSSNAPGSQGKSIEMQREELMGDTSEDYTLLLRDYACDHSEANAVTLTRDGGSQIYQVSADGGESALRMSQSCSLDTVPVY